MTGTLANVAGIVVGSLAGLIFKKGIPERVNDAVLKVQGFAISIIGLNGVLGTMITADTSTGKLSDSGGLLLLISLTLGCIVGEALRIDDRANQFGRWVEGKIHSDGFARGFVSASLLFSIGTMAIIGPINDGLFGDPSLLYIKAMLDGILSIVLASSLGAGVLFSFVPVLMVEGVLTLLARRLSPFISDPLLAVFCMVGYSIVICIGLGLFTSVKIKAANLLPSLIVPVVYYFVAMA